VTSLYEVPLRGHELVHPHRCPSTGGGVLLVAYVADVIIVPAHDQSIGSPRRTAYLSYHQA
jgi:hypothetical protein